MADRKARSFQFKVPLGTRLRDIKNEIEQQIDDNYVTVFQEVGAHEYLIELARATHVDELIEHGFDVEDFHFNCHPPHGYYLNVGVMGLKAFISDEEVINKLSTYGEIKGEVVRLKYKQDHELGGVENGNRLICMILTAQSIPYSLQIRGEWCRIIHNNQQRICSNCNEVGHSRKDCPTIECRRCHQLGHLSFHCHTIDANYRADDEPNMENTEDKNEPQHSVAEEEIMDDQEVEQPRMDNIETPTQAEQAEKFDATKSANNNSTLKRQHPTDSDSDARPLPRRRRGKHQPNVKAARGFKKHDDPEQSKMEHSIV